MAELAQAENCGVYVKLPKNMQHMHGTIPYMFYCWADPVDRLLLLKSYMVKLKINNRLLNFKCRKILQTFQALSRVQFCKLFLLQFSYVRSARGLYRLHECVEER